MNLRHLCLVFTLGIFFPAQAQLVKSFNLVAPAQQSTILLSGNKSTVVPFLWSGGKANAPVGTNFDYTIFFDVPSGDFSMPLDNITKTCCASYFNDTLFSYDEGIWADFLNPISQQIRGREFLIGDTLDLKWRVIITAAAPGPVYENEECSQDFSVRFVRGQFVDEYVPLSLYAPANNSVAAIGGDPNQTLTFSWSSAYCPLGCAPAEYALMLDTVNGDFTSPYYIVSVPGNDSSYQLDFSTLNQLLKDTKTPEQSSRVVFWKILATGNSQVIPSVQTSQLIVWNLSLNNENRPFKLVNPMSNSVITLKGPGSTQLNFKWESTLTPVKNTEKYYLAFDTIGASPLFSNPVFQFEVPGDGEDTAINLTYGLIDRALDSVYGSNWGKVKLMWAAVAQINGTLYYPTSYNDVEFRTGLISAIEPAVANDLSIYPNPAGETVTLSIPVAGFSWTLCNALGAVIKEGKTSGNEEQIPVTELEKGVYFIQVEQGGSFRNARILVTP